MIPLNTVSVIDQLRRHTLIGRQQALEADSGTLTLQHITAFFSLVVTHTHTHTLTRMHTKGDKPRSLTATVHKKVKL